VILCGIPIAIEAITGLVKDLNIKAGILVTIALASALYLGEIFAAGEIALIMAIGEFLEDRTVNKARQGIERLIGLTPRTARLLEGNVESIVNAKTLKVGDIVRVLPGETIPTDGIIIRGKTSIDQSILTGESLPLDKFEGDEVFSGTTNQFGGFEMRVTVEEGDSSLQRMIALVQSADAGKAKIVRAADYWATWVVLGALASALLTWTITGEVIRAVTVLVVFCPCALVLSTPTAIVAAIGNVTKHGMLVKEGDALERLSKVNHIMFDKTGTLTYGKPVIIKTISFLNDFPEEETIRLVASAEMLSEHPLGKAVVNHASVMDLDLERPDAFELILGRGVSSMVRGSNVLAGSMELMEESGIAVSEDVKAVAGQYSEEGCTVVLVSLDKVLIGALVLSDTLRNDSRQTLDRLHDMGIKVTLLTGDRASSANHIAKSVGIGDVVSECLPEDKLKSIVNQESHGDKVCMIGDGINDAPALKAATVGIAMGGIGSDIAIDAADIALMGDDIKGIPHLFGLSRKMMRKIHFNLSASMILNFIAVGLAMMGVLTPVTGALVHNVGSIVVILNSALLIRWGFDKG